MFINYCLFIGDQNMIQNTPSPQPNPLSAFMRQPKIYIRLPSNGEYWPEGSLVMTETGDLPVYSMTAKDELMLKVPDALISGQAVVDIIQHCIPNIKNAWHIPTIDLDVILIGIRLATYGEKMITPITLGDEVEMEYHVDLRNVLDVLMQQISWNPVIPINDDLTVYVRPLPYNKISESAVRTFETQKIIDAVNDENLDQNEKLRIFKESFSKLTEITIGVVESSIFRIDSPLGSTENSDHIKEFIENTDKDVFNKIKEHLDNLREQNAVKSIRVPVTDDLREKGFTGEFIEVPLVFDPSTFFV